ncbi:hypothetical protein TrST_g12370 [Triparma strigata]|uniref:Fe2OG dioxygenase domain-containing protein n=1 Tax=Triparma strigata TaxID=1606541 RepID=A0A9W7A2W6_9STRA|nr:hypothetical protein TrST_g12370 [Triparma strigata]
MMILNRRPSLCLILLIGFLIEFNNCFSSVTVICRRRCHLINSALNAEQGPLTPSQLSYAVSTIQAGHIAVIDDFLPKSFTSKLREDASNLYSQNLFEADGLASYTTTKTFDPNVSRQVLKSASWHSIPLGDSGTRRSFGTKMHSLRTQISSPLLRPTLKTGTLNYQTDWPDIKKKHEISYTRYSVNASLGRHTDEHCEMLKKREGWVRPTRRSVSWLVYLNDDWSVSNGGELRCYERKYNVSGKVGATEEGDLQVGWLAGDKERAVFLDARGNGYGNMVRLFVEEGGRREYVTGEFPADPTLYLAGGVGVRVFFNSDVLGRAYQPLEPPKTPSDQFLKSPTLGYETVKDVLPLEGRLVMFDSVALPHEVLECYGRERWSCSGWFHEDQQEG